jgi:hypothetical protein
MEELLMNYSYGVVVRRTKRKSTLRDILAGPTSLPQMKEVEVGMVGMRESQRVMHNIY